MDDLSYLEMNCDWHCKMCGVTLEQALVERFDLTKIPDKEITNGTYKRKRKQYIFDRTQESPKLTCGGVCGNNYKAWKKNLDSKSSYIKEDIICDVCDHLGNGGRVMVRGNKKIKVCRKCHRVYSRKLMLKEWERLHLEERNIKRRAWNKENPDKIKAYKRKWRNKQK